MTDRRAAQVLGAIGRLLVAAGVVILLFAGYQLWGTGLSEAKAQDELSSDFADRLAAAAAGGATDTGDGTPTGSSTTAPPSTATSTASSIAPATPADTAAPATTAAPAQLVDLLYPESGEPVARIVIPDIGVDKVVVEGVEVEDLRKGPGHFPDTPLPGQAGNAAIAGHRTTYGAPFGDIDQLEIGDEIRVTTVQGEFVYTVAGQEIVQPEQVEVVGPFGDNRLTLTACHPKFSAAQRIIVWAELQGSPVETVPRPEDRRTVDLTPSTAAPTTVTPTSAAATTGGTATTTTPTTAATTTTLPTTTEVTLDPSITHLAGDSGAWPGAIAWGAATVAAAAAAWVLAWRLDVARGRRWTRRWAVYAAASPVVAVLLFLCFANVDRLLPAY
ncbi:MAG: class E sortase [Acidimicrobiales bacterium]